MRWAATRIALTAGWAAQGDGMLMDEARIVSRDEAPPFALWAIAVLALSPFPASAIAYGYGPPDIARPALTLIMTWTAVVLSFLGGVRWGMETLLPQPRWYRQVISVLSALAAWLLLLARHRFPDTWILTGAIAAFLLQWLFDHQGPDVPARYPKLSTAITAAACVSLAVCLDQALRA
ncbi:DUF3429 domain-containing protein [Phenylobacterium soli]|uniref:DUF3429 domain-containing protein n=2 Tax=Phenylobacterium soli TaxID=2170551 RepID=A0A328AK00_9CAUL|nr:DUF3429 domain-containing protein [Phenylobacterium soli]